MKKKRGKSVKFLAAVFFLIGATVKSETNGERLPDGHWGVAIGVILVQGEYEEREYWANHCDRDSARRIALVDCEADGAEDCRILGDQVKYCTTKCVCF